MKRILSIIVAATIAAASMATPADAQTSPEPLDPRLNVTNVELFVTDSGNLVVQLTPEQRWGNQLIADLFSWFFAFDISNDLVQAGGLLQVHDGEITVNGLLATPTSTSEVRPQIFFGPEGVWIRFVIGLALLDQIAGVPSLSWIVSAASMATPTSERAVFPGWSGQMDLPADLPTIDPRAGAIGELDDAGNWVKIANPTPAPTEAPTSTAASTTTPTVTESATPASTASTPPASQGGAAGGAGASGGAARGTTAFWVFSIAVFLLMITMFLYLRGRRSRRRGLELDGASLSLNDPSWDLPAELGEIYTDMTEAERRQAIKDFDAVKDKAAYIEYYKALQKYHAGDGSNRPPDKPAGI